MTLHIDDVDFSEHAIGKLDDLDGVGVELLYGRITYGHGFFFRDTEDNSGSYDIYLADKDVSASFSTEFRGLRKVAFVKTVFPIQNAHQRYWSGSRFVQVE